MPLPPLLLSLLISNMKHFRSFYPPRSPAPMPSTSSMMMTRCCCFSFTPPKFSTDVPIIPRRSESSAYAIIDRKGMRKKKQARPNVCVSCHQSSYIYYPTKHVAMKNKIKTTTLYRLVSCVRSIQLDDMKPQTLCDYPRSSCLPDARGA